MAKRKSATEATTKTSAKEDTSTPDERAEIGRKLAEQALKDRTPIR